MIKKTFLYLLIASAVFIGLVLYNYRQAQVRLKQTRETKFEISLVESPKNASVKTPANFKWLIDAPDNFITNTTTIYWSYDSSPSALTKLDSPKAVGYPNKTEDYIEGNFKLPDEFDLNISFPKAGTIYFRAYALVGNDHLWTEEKSLFVK